MPIKKRLWALSLASGISGLFAVPYLLTSRPDINPIDIWIGLPIGSLVICALCSWAGLKFADRANISMPYLRPWETGKPADAAERGWLIRVCIAAGGLFGFAGAAFFYLVGAPPHPGALTLRLSTFPFAALVPEIVAHLFVMSGLVVVMKRTWIPILLSAAVFALVFHVSLLIAGPTPAYAWVFEYLFGVLTGWIYSRYGIEGSALTHAVAYAIWFGLT